jgi:hypothetical protein
LTWTPISKNRQPVLAFGNITMTLIRTVAFVVSSTSDGLRQHRNNVNPNCCFCRFKITSARQALLLELDTI